MSLAAILSTQPKSAQGAGEIRVPLLDRYAKAHPAADAPEVELATLPEALTRKFRRDQHFAAYAASTPHRLSGESLATTTATMQLAVFDIDDPGKVDGHARDEWRDVERPKIAQVVENFGMFGYLTRGGYRLVGRLDEPITISNTIDAESWKARYRSWLRFLARVYGIEADPATADWPRLYRAPHSTRERGGPPEDMATYGDAENIGTWAPALAPEDIVQPEAPRVARAITPREGEDPGARIAPLGIRVAHALIAAENLPPSVSGQRGHDALLVAASTIRNGFALPREVAHNLLETVFNPRCSPVWTSREISHKLAAVEGSDEGWGERIAGILISETAEDVLRQRRREPANENGAAPASARERTDEATCAAGTGTKRTAFALTETGNAERLVHRHAHALRYVTTWHKWIAWDGRRWSVEGADALVQQATKETVRSFDKEIARLDDDQRSLLRKWAIKSETRQARDAMISLARHEAAMTIEHARLDRDPWLLNVRNGTIDLRSGDLRPHDPANLITKMAPVEFDLTAACPAWEKFVGEIMCGDESLTRYIQRALGYSLTGIVREQCLFFLHGGGANGKSTLLDALLNLLGDYATAGAPNLLLAKHGESHPTEQAAICGARLVSCQEVEEGRAWAESTIKQLTGSDRISARRMREDFWSFDPTHKFWVSGNHKPNVRGTDDGIWRRFRLVEFAASFKGRADKGLPARLQAELPGILNWAIQGCLAWQREGLNEPAAVSDATAGYRKEQDLVGSFLTEFCVLEPTAAVKRSDLRRAYELYCERMPTKPVAAKTFASSLRERGIENRGTTRATAPEWIWRTCLYRRADVPESAWRGIRVREEAELE